MRINNVFPFLLSTLCCFKHANRVVLFNLSFFLFQEDNHHEQFLIVVPKTPTVDTLPKEDETLSQFFWASCFVVLLSLSVLANGVFLYLYFVK